MATRCFVRPRGCGGSLPANREIDLGDAPPWLSRGLATGKGAGRDEREGDVLGHVLPRQELVEFLESHDEIGTGYGSHYPSEPMPSTSSRSPPTAFDSSVSAQEQAERREDITRPAARGQPVGHEVDEVEVHHVCCSRVTRVDHEQGRGTRHRVQLLAWMGGVPSPPTISARVRHGGHRARPIDLLRADQARPRARFREREARPSRAPERPASGGRFGFDEGASGTASCACPARPTARPTAGCRSRSAASSAARGRRHSSSRATTATSTRAKSPS